MKNKILFKNKKQLIRVAVLFTLMIGLGIPQNSIFSQSDQWVAPASTDSYNNPYKGSDKATKAGKKLYAQMCAICHGNKGKGDGMAGISLKPRPANFTKDIVQKQTDGAIFWKLSEGKAPMASYKNTLSEEQRWQLINYLRTFDK